MADRQPGVKRPMTGTLPGWKTTDFDNSAPCQTLGTGETPTRSPKVPGVTALFAASGDLGNFTGFRQGAPRPRARHQHRPRRDHQSWRGAARPIRLARSPRLHLFQAGSETAAIARGVAAELGRWPTHKRSRTRDRSRHRPRHLGRQIGSSRRLDGFPAERVYCLPRSK